MNYGEHSDNAQPTEQCPTVSCHLLLSSSKLLAILRLWIYKNRLGSQACKAIWGFIKRVLAREDGTFGVGKTRSRIMDGTVVERYVSVARRSRRGMLLIICRLVHSRKKTAAKACKKKQVLLRKAKKKRPRACEWPYVMRSLEKVYSRCISEFPSRSYPLQTMCAHKYGIIDIQDFS